MHDSITRKKCGGLCRRRRQSVANDGECRRDATPFPTDAWEGVSCDSGLLMPAKMTCSQGKLFAEKE